MSRENVYMDDPFVPFAPFDDLDAYTHKAAIAAVLVLRAAGLGDYADRRLAEGGRSVRRLIVKAAFVLDIWAKHWPGFDADVVDFARRVDTMQNDIAKLTGPV